MDPLTLSLNTTRPTALRAVIALAILAKRRSQADHDEQVGYHIRNALSLLEPHFSPAIDPSLAVAAALGEGLTSLIFVDGNWIADRLATVLISHEEHKSFADVLVTTSLAVSHASTSLLDALAPLLETILNRGANSETIDSGWRTQRSPLAPDLLK